jgi:hypothetical protein
VATRGRTCARYPPPLHEPSRSPAGPRREPDAVPYTWIAGHWDWNGYEWQWNAGHYEADPNYQYDGYDYNGY